MNQTCELCHTNVPTMYCSCTGVKIFLCDACFIPHRSKNPSLLHPSANLETNHNLVAYQQLCVSFTAGKKELLGNLDRIDLCCEEVTATVEELVQKLYAYRDSVVQQLQEWKGSLSAELYKAVQEVEATLPQESVQLHERYADALRNFQEGNLQLFRYRVDASGVATAIQEMLSTEYPQPKQTASSANLSSTTQLGRSPVSPLVNVMSDSIRLFNLETRKWEPAIKLNSPITIDGKVNYTLLDEGRIFCCEELLRRIVDSFMIVSMYP